LLHLALSKFSNDGLQLEKFPDTHYVFGADKIGREVLVEDGNWLHYKPEDEHQANNRFDSMGCFPYDTLVLTEDFSERKICSIKKGDYVISHTGKRQKVVRTYKKDFNENLFYIKINGIYKEIECTKEHPILTKRGWVRADELKIDDYVAVPDIRKLTKDLSVYEIEKNKMFLWLLGFYLAEGSLGNPRKCNDNNLKLKVNGDGDGSGTITFSISKDENQYLEKIKIICEKLFETNVRSYVSDKSKSIDVRLYHPWLKNVLKELGGEYCKTKELNKRLMFMEPELQLEIFKGWFDGDGWVRKKKNELGAITISRTLAWQMYRILLRNNIKCSIIKKEALDNHQSSYTVSVYSDSIDKILDTKTKANNSVSSYFDNDILFRKIMKIETKKRLNISVVYNLEVENDNSYIVNSVAVHNCTGYALLNCIEMIAKKKFGEDWNKSDRFTNKMSGTTTSGNTMTRVLDSVRKNHGAVKETSWPWDGTFTWAKYYASIDQQIQKLGKEFLDKYYVGYEIVPQNRMLIAEALKKSPLYVAGYAWYLQNGLYRSYGRANHAFTVVRQLGSSYTAYDSYPPYVKPLAPDYLFQALFTITVERKQAGFNQLEIDKLIARGFKYIMRTDVANGGKGQIYELTKAGMRELDTLGKITEAVKVLAAQKNLTGISESDFSKLLA